MTPHRAPSLAGYAAGNLKSLAQVPVDTVGVAAAGVVAVLGFAFGAANVAMLWVVGLAMLLDLVTGALKAVDSPVEVFSVQKLYGGFIGKLFRLLLIPAASLIDWLVVASPLPLPDGYAATFPVTAFAMVGLAAAEITSVLNKLRDGGVAPELIAEIMRRLDRIRTGEEPPMRRHYDVPAVVSEIERTRPPDSPPPLRERDR